MKYIVNEQNTCGQASIADAARNQLLESLGYKTAQPIEENHVSFDELADNRAQADAEEEAMPTLYEWDGGVFALEEEVFEIDGDLFLKAFELDAETRMHLDESHADLFINEVSFDSSEFSLGDIYDYGSDSYIKLDEFKKGSKSKVKPGDDPDFTTDQRKGDKSKTHAGEDFKKKGNGNGDDDENGNGNGHSKCEGLKKKVKR